MKGVMMFTKKILLVMLFLCSALNAQPLKPAAKVSPVEFNNKKFGFDIFSFGLKPSYIVSKNLELVFPVSYAKSIGLAENMVLEDLKNDWQKLFAGVGLRWKFIPNSNWFMEPVVNMGWVKNFKANYLAVNPQLFFGYMKEWKYVRAAVAVGPQYEYRFKDPNNFLFLSELHQSDAKRTGKLKVFTLLPAAYVSIGFSI